MAEVTRCQVKRLENLNQHCDTVSKTVLINESKAATAVADQGTAHNQGTKGGIWIKILPGSKSQAGSAISNRVYPRINLSEPEKSWLVEEWREGSREAHRDTEQGGHGSQQVIELKAH